jgi:hypothetical protein
MSECSSSSSTNESNPESDSTPVSWCAVARFWREQALAHERELAQLASYSDTAQRQLLFDAQGEH